MYYKCGGGIHVKNGRAAGGYPSIAESVRRAVGVSPPVKTRHPVAGLLPDTTLREFWRRA